MKKELIAHQLKVKHVEKETENSVTIFFEIPSELKNKFIFKSGQFISIIEDIHQEEVSRSYSLSSSPSFDSDEFAITVKKVVGGKMSPFLVDKIKVNSQLWCTPPAGSFGKEILESNSVYLFAAGSGITPIFSLLKEALKSKNVENVTLFYSNKSEDEIIFKNQLDHLEDHYKNKLKVFHLLSKKPFFSSKFLNRLDKDLLESLFKTNHVNLNSKFFICGPDFYMTQLKSYLKNIGVENDKIYSESFNTQIVSNHKTSTSSSMGFKNGIQSNGTLLLSSNNTFDIDTIDHSPESTQLEVELDGDFYNLNITNTDQSILEFALEEGINPPYSCMSGACMACAAKLVEGSILQPDPGILTEENIENKEFLTCQATAKSKKLKIKFLN